MYMTCVATAQSPHLPPAVLMCSRDRRLQGFGGRNREKSSSWCQSIAELCCVSKDSGPCCHCVHAGQRGQQWREWGREMWVPPIRWTQTSFTLLPLTIQLTLKNQPAFCLFGKVVWTADEGRWPGRLCQRAELERMKAAAGIKLTSDPFDGGKLYTAANASAGG